MKKCLKCGKENRDENVFCSECGNNSFEFAAEKPQEITAPAAQMPTAQMPAPPIHTQYVHAAPKKSDFTKFDLMTILGFVSAIVGTFYIGLILEPLAAVTSIIGFMKGTRCKGLAAAGFVIAVIALLIRLFYTLYVNGVIPKWVVSGSFDL